MKNRFKITIILASLMVMLFSISVFAADNTTISTKYEGEAKTGEEITIKVELANNSTLIGATVDINYDVQQLEYVSGSIVDAYKSLTVYNELNKIADGQIRMATMHSDTCAYNGTLVELKFKVLSAGGQKVAVNVNSELVDTNYNVINTVNKGTEFNVKCNHTYGEYKVTKEATCTQKGEETAVCSICGDKTTRDIAEKEHEYSAYTIAKEPTETESGILERKCKNCDNKQTKDTFKLVTTIKDTTTENGLLKEQYNVGDKLSLNVSDKDMGMDNTSPEFGDIRYVPAQWSIASGSETIGRINEFILAPFMCEFEPQKAGDYELKVVYSRQVYGTIGWLNDETKYTVSTPIKVVEQVETETQTESATTQTETDSNNNKTEGADTADKNIIAIYVMAMVCALGVSACILSKKKNA